MIASQYVTFVSFTEIMEDMIGENLVGMETASFMEKKRWRVGAKSVMVLDALIIQQ
ncbi:MAG: hypothetical protein PHQ74_15315 [Crocinitomicaceae bacterium]|nr:hypothetical protein [Crocinitomicaceae bacterium]